MSSDSDTSTSYDTSSSDEASDGSNDFSSSSGDDSFSSSSDSESDSDSDSEDEWSVSESERGMMAKDEWSKFKKVQSLLRTVNDYMAIYSRLKESGELIVIGSEGIKHPRHGLPSEYKNDKETWNALDKNEQYICMRQQAEATMGPMESLGKALSERYGVEYRPGPLKGEDRIKQKRDADYEGDVRRVIDFVRCSFVIVMKSLDQAKDIIDNFRPGIGEMAEEWVLVRIKDGFEKPENFLVGGYRDIKVNARYKPTGHIIEIQLHLKPYLDLKESGGHKHYEFARTLNVSGVTNATQILHTKLLNGGYISQCGEEEMKKVENKKEKKNRIKKAQILRNLGDLYSEERLYGKKAVFRYDLAMKLLDKKPMKLQSTKVLYCQILMGMSYCVSEIQRHPDRFGTKKKYMEMDIIPMTEKAIELLSDTLGATHPYTMRTERIQADYYDTKDQPEKAQPIYASVLDRMVNILGHDHPEVIELMNNYGDLLTDRDDNETIVKGFTTYMEAFEAALKRLGPEHPTTRMLLGNMICVGDPERGDHDWILAENPNLKKHLLHVLSNPKWSNHFEEEILIFNDENWIDDEEFSDEDDGEGDY